MRCVLTRQLKAAYRLLSRLREAFPRLPICICGDSLYAGMPFFELCKENNFPYLLRFKEGKIPYIYKEYMALRQEQGNVMKECYEGLECIYDYVAAVDYDGYLTTLISYEEYRTRKDRKKNKGDSKEHHKFFFLTDLRVSRKNQKQTVYYGRRRWLIENQGFNDQKNWGYNLEHRFSHNYKGMKNHYYLIQIAHMISQLVDALDTIWEKVRESRTQRHAHLLKAFCSESIKDNMSGGKRCLRIHSGSG